MTAQRNVCNANAYTPSQYTIYYVYIYVYMENLLKAFHETFNAIIHCAANNSQKNPTTAFVWSYRKYVVVYAYLPNVVSRIIPHYMPKVKQKLFSFAIVCMQAIAVPAICGACATSEIMKNVNKIWHGNSNCIIHALNAKTYKHPLSRGNEVEKEMNCQN